ncbi:beta-glucosidase [Porphyromonadaceae bacterium KH3CP3RA]|nr:beta-glucosidase [Porphyromonadaceae bacterium KH3CP3RA]
MKKQVTFIVVLCFCVVTQLSMAQQRYKDSSAPVEERVKDLLSLMTTEEKIGQLCFPTGWEMYTKTGEYSVTPSDLFRERMQAMPLGGLLGHTPCRPVDPENVTDRT